MPYEPIWSGNDLHIYDASRGRTTSREVRDKARSAGVTRRPSRPAELNRRAETRVLWFSYDTHE